MSVNKVILVGCLGKDPEFTTMQDGKKISKFSLATNERKDSPEWHRIVVFNEKLVEIVEKYVKKGSRLYVEGQIQTRKWVDKTNVEKSITEVVVSSYKGQITLLDSSSDKQEGRQSQSSYMNDDLPF